MRAISFTFKHCLLPPPLWGRDEQSSLSWVGDGGSRELGACNLPLSLTHPHKGGENAPNAVR
jgi:hypothetical protein